MPWCFAHRLAKFMYPDYRLMIENIALVCSIECHAKVDKRTGWEERNRLEKEFRTILEKNDKNT